MSMHKTIFAAVLAVPFTLLSTGSDAATVAGAVTLDITDGRVSGTADSGTGALTSLTVAGSFATRNTLCCLVTKVDAWQMTSDVTYFPSTGGQESSQLVEIGAPGRSWSNLRADFLDAPVTSLFTFISFFDSMVTQGLTGGGTATGTDEIGGVPTDWSVNATLNLFQDIQGNRDIRTSGTFEFTVNPSETLGGLDDFYATFGSFTGIGDDTAGLVSGDQEFMAKFRVAAIPLPGALPMLAGGLGVFGMIAWRRKQRLAA